GRRQRVMKTFCSSCEQWSLLPLDGGTGERAHAKCEHCTAPLQAEGYYSRCRSCGHYYLEADPMVKGASSDVDNAGQNEQSALSGTTVMDVGESAQVEFANRSPRLQPPSTACLLCNNVPSTSLVVDEVAVAYTTEAQTRKSRDGKYYIQLYMD